MLDDGFSQAYSQPGYDKLIPDTSKARNVIFSNQLKGRVEK